eukprot:CAMPEP_0180555868 /NCGR_PEP_ID=MMETSP1037_2-20121125/243_1 /TAXON_ID=632150 /ORGANISM="Azadinium spinosum, Strain 3D9" /LENGTH=55 /DNA_ID=CAMNT_0022571803 /DNA_START=165 /DNA_END=329 /DNA_ORIENTATION=+
MLFCDAGAGSLNAGVGLPRADPSNGVQLMQQKAVATHQNTCSNKGDPAGGMATAP